MADFTAKITWIAEVDVTGSPGDYISEGLRGSCERERCIDYRSSKDRIEVLRAMHAAKDVKLEDRRS